MATQTEHSYLGYLINPSGVLVKPKNIAHMKTLMQTESRWVVDPQSGTAKQTGGFRIASAEEIQAMIGAETEKSRRMERQELERKKRNAQIVMMAPDEATLERLVESRQAKRPPTQGV